MEKRKKTGAGFPFFVFIFAVYPSLAYLASNYREVHASSVLRLVVFSILVVGILLALCFLLLRKSSKAVLASSVLTLVFFSLGHVIDLVENTTLYKEAGKPALLVNGFLFLSSLLIIVVAIRQIGRISGDPAQLFRVMNVTAIVLLASSCALLLGKYIQENESPARQAPPAIIAPPNSPDVYYIVLDAYARQDAMSSLGYDNSSFISELEEIGFYVASCSRSNYPQTVVSMASALNMGYLWDVIPHDGPDDRNAEPVYGSLSDSEVRRQFESRGYQTVAFETGGAWLDWRDASRFMQPAPEPFLSPHLSSFEYLFLETTALRPILTQPYFLKNKYIYNYNRINFVLGELPKLALESGPKFVYVHMLIPHRPNIFLPDGSLNPDTNYYIKGVGEGATTEYDIQGYINNTRFIDSRLPGVIREVIRNSRIPPIVIIQSDHGYQKQDIRFYNLNTYYFPDGDYSRLYPSITPVNSFRVVFNQFFGAEYPALKDQSINVDIDRPYGKKPARFNPDLCP